MLYFGQPFVSNFHDPRRPSAIIFPWGRAGKADSVPIPTILCIDDEALGLEIRKAVLERAGYQVLTAVDGVTGLTLFRGNPVDGVVLDYYMPEMNGGAVAEAMRRERPEIPIMLLSAYINLPTEVVQLADVTVLKGEGPQELLEKLRAMLHSTGTAGGALAGGAS
jgi:CheY-like chemotaxis protein